MKGSWRQRRGDEREGRNNKEADVEKWLDKEETRSEQLSRKV